MNSINRTPGLLTKEERQQSVDAVIGYFHTNRNETIGVIAAEEILDFFFQNAGKFVNNTALDKARTELQKVIEDTDFRISELRQ